jgi:hypothetical protein
MVIDNASQIFGVSNTLLSPSSRVHIAKVAVPVSLGRVPSFALVVVGRPHFLIGARLTTMSKTLMIPMRW